MADEALHRQIPTLQPRPGDALHQVPLTQTATTGSCQASCHPPYKVTDYTTSNYNIKLLCDYPCQDGYYLYPDGKCYQDCPSPYNKTTDSYEVDYCTSICTTSKYLTTPGYCRLDCSGPLDLMQTIRGILICLSSCGSTQYLYWNGTCEDTCPSPLRSDGTASPKTCNYDCSSGQYLFPNGTCYDKCDSFLVNSTRYGENFCISTYPLSTSGHIYWDGSSQVTCNPPLLSTNKGGIDICQYPCNDTSYLYPDGSCDISCSSPLSSSLTLTKNLCNTRCSSSQWLLPNGSCSTTCSPPMMSHNLHSILLCSSPCQTFSEFYFPDKNLCESACNVPNIANVTAFYRVCHTVFSQSMQAMIMKGINSAGAVGTASLALTSLASPGDSSGASLSSLAKMLLYIRYIDINYPLELEDMFKGTKPSSVSLSLGLELTAKDKNRFAHVPVPEKFASYGLTSSFLIGFWDDLVLLNIIFVLILIIFAFECIAKQVQSKTLSYSLFQKIRIIAQNFLLLQFYTSCSEIILFASIQIQKIKIESFLDGLGLALAFLFIAFTVILLSIHINLVSVHQKIKQKGETDGNMGDFENFYLKKQGLQVLYSNFKASSILHEGYLFFTILRTILFNFTIAILYQQPLAQAIIILVLTTVMVLYLIAKRPFKMLVNFLQQTIAEIILLIVNVCVLSLSIMDKIGDMNHITRNRIAHVVIICSLIFKFLPTAFATIKVAIFAKTYYDQWRSKKGESNRSCTS